MLADPTIGDRIVRKADGGRRLKAIREIPDQYLLSVSLYGDDWRPPVKTHGTSGVPVAPDFQWPTVGSRSDVTHSRAVVTDALRARDSIRVQLAKYRWEHTICHPTDQELQEALSETSGVFHWRQHRQSWASEEPSDEEMEKERARVSEAMAGRWPHTVPYEVALRDIRWLEEELWSLGDYLAGLDKRSQKGALAALVPQLVDKMLYHGMTPEAVNAMASVGGGLIPDRLAKLLTKNRRLIESSYGARARDAGPS